MSIVAITLSLLLIGGSACCDNEVAKEIFSPNATHRAVVFNRGCGATTGFNTEISILGSSEGLHGSGNLWVADDSGDSPSGSWGGPDVHLRWLSQDTLEVQFASGLRVFKQEGRVDGITAVYVQR